ncbi:MAG: serine hydrolase [Saprospiraceae bacterium]
MRPYWFFFISLIILSSCHRKEKGFEQIYAPFLQSETAWADSLLQQMTLEEKIGQLVILQTEEGFQKDSLTSWVTDLGLAGWMPSAVSTTDYLFLTRLLQQQSKIPLMFGTAQTVALNNQFTDVIDYPLPATISAIPSRKKKDVLLAQYIKQCKALNLQFSLAPGLQMADTTRALYDSYALENDAEELLFRSYSIMHELQKEKIFSIAGPFKELYFSTDRDEEEVSKRDSLMNQYFNLSQNGLSGLVIDNAAFKADTNRFYPYNFLKDYLQEHASFDGLIFGFPNAQNTAFDLLHGGVDVLLVKQNPRSIISQIRKSIVDGFLTEEQLDVKVRKLLLAKTWLELDKEIPSIGEEEMETFFAKENHVYPIYELFESALTLANNMDSILPFKNLDQQSFRLVQLGDPSMRVFEKAFAKYDSYSTYPKLRIDEETNTWPALNTKKLKKKTTVITLANVLLDKKRDAAIIKSINDWSKNNKVVLVNFGSPFNLRPFAKTVTMVQAYELNGTTQSQAAQLLFGGMKAEGKLPIALNGFLDQGQGFSNEITRLKYGMAEEVGIAPHKLVDIDAVVYRAIKSGAMPGCQVLVVKSGNVIYDKSFGHFTYDKKQKVGSNHLYDIASVTKVAATTLAAMKAYETKKLSLKKTLSTTLGLDKRKLRNITTRDLLIHRSGLQSYVPITKYLNNRDTLVNGCNDYFCKISQGDYNVRIGDSLYLNYHHIDSIWDESFAVKRKRRKRYLYSDLNFVLLQKAIEKQTKSSLDKYVDRYFYKPLNLRHTTFNPIKKFSKSEIAPTAMDSKWRKEQVQGYVHDETASLLGGVAGNAGVFSNATDMATLFQMLLNKGSYGGEQYLKPETVDLFTKKTSGHRGLGFEVKTSKGTRGCSPYATNYQTFGHRGFTGTCVWVDKEQELVYIFLTNRIYPDYKNNRLAKKKIRSRVHSVIYKALNSYEPKKIEVVLPEREEVMASWPVEDCEVEG